MPGARHGLVVLVALSLALTGCVGIGPDESVDDTPTPETELPTPDSTATETPAQQPTATATPPLSETATPQTRTATTTDAARPTATPDSTPQPTATATDGGYPNSTSTASPTATPTETPTPTPTPTPTEPPTPTPTDTPTPTATPDGGDSTLTVTVTDVVDGDTIDIRFDNGTTDTVRLLGVDTPEVYGDVSPDEFEGVPDTEAGRECLRDWGSEASTFATETLDGESVTLQFDEASDRRGTFDRLLAYVVVDGETFNYRLVADGYARVYDSTFTQSDRFYDAEADAQDAETGLWECRSVSTPTETPTPDTETDLTVVEIHADAEGNDHENLDDEYVVFRNDGQDTLDLTGWSVEDEADHTYTFPDEFTLDPGEEVTLHTGSGDDTDTDLYWGSGSAIWNNGGDTVFVSDADGTTVIEKSYGSLTAAAGVVAVGGLVVVVVVLRNR